VDKRLDADAPLGFLLSGGLDSSLVCAISAKLLGRHVRTFAIGMDTDAIDLKYAREAADFIGAEHTEVYMTRQEVLEAWRRSSPCWAPGTSPPSGPAWACICAARPYTKRTDVRVLLTGEISDELFGYKYTDFAPSPEAFQLEAKKRVDELYMYDVLRADRCISVNSIEARVPFGDIEFVKVRHVHRPRLKVNSYGMGKYLLRHAFEGDHLLPEDILWRQKAAFSDAVGHSMVDDLKEYAAEKYSDAEFETKRMRYDYGRPFTKESLLYREIFEKYYPARQQNDKGFLDAQQGLEGLRRVRSLGPCAVKLRRERR
jgi:asparagine synthase (glutamine-hydrolysing)